jgi:Ca2+-binding EF-hand superfamily protein
VGNDPGKRKRLSQALLSGISIGDRVSTASYVSRAKHGRITNMRLVSGLIALTMLTGFSAQAGAQDMDLMQFADADHDGKVTSEEYTAFREQGWGFFTQGADKVKPADLDPMAQGAFKGVAADADGYVTKAAYMAVTPAFFKAADKNGDGVLSSEELNNSMKPAG